MLITPIEQSLIQVLPFGFILLNFKKEFLFWNKAAEHLLHLTDNENKQKVQDYISQLNLGVTEIQAPHNKDVHLSLQMQAYHDNQYFLLVQDVTHIYRLEKMRQNFVANVSHELRTPLTVFKGYLDLLLSNPKIDKELTLLPLKQMAEQSQRMENLVNDLLLLANLENEELNITKHKLIHVPELIESICRDVQSLNQEHPHQFIIELDKTLNIVGSQDELHSAFSNIIVNAVRYTPNQGTITVRWYQKDGQAHFEVKDTGIGIATHHIDRLTQRFYRVDKARSRDQGGTGLGLAIVKHVLLRHHAQLTIQSQLKNGSLFRCSFPLKESEICAAH